MNHFFKEKLLLEVLHSAQIFQETALKSEIKRQTISSRKLTTKFGLFVCCSCPDKTINFSFFINSKLECLHRPTITSVPVINY